MHLRIWSSGLDESRSVEYDQFAEGRSVPMFHAQPGFCGVYFGRAKGRRMVFTFWDDAASAAGLDTSPSYQEVVSEIVAAGFLCGESTVEVVWLDGFHPHDKLSPGRC